MTFFLVVCGFNVYFHFIDTYVYQWHPIVLSETPGPDAETEFELEYTATIITIWFLNRSKSHW